MKKMNSLIAVAAFAATGIVGNASAGTYTEVTDGTALSPEFSEFFGTFFYSGSRLIADAQVADMSGAGPTAIQTAVYVGGDVDTFQIEIDDPANFSATVTDVFGGASYSLYLFDDVGSPVVASLGDSANGVKGGLTSAFVSAPGTYYLSISQPDNMAQDGGVAMFDAAMLVAEQGPVPSLVPFVLDTDRALAFEDAGAAPGYIDGIISSTGLITLTGVAVPEPASLGLIVVGGLTMLRRRR